MPGTKSDRWNAVVVVIVKDEAAYIYNWIIYYLSLGFEHIFIYDNNSSDNLAEKVSRFINGGVVTLLTWPSRAGQVDAYNQAVYLLRGRSDWVGFFDVDEYLVLHEHETITDFLTSRDADEIIVPWRNFPHGGHEAAPGGTDLENYFWAHRNHPDLAVQVKHLVRPEIAVHTTAHFSAVEPGRKIVLANGAPGNPSHLLKSPDYRGAQLNHYSTRSHAENVKRLLKGQADGGAEKKIADFASLTAQSVAYLEYDESILRHFRAFALERERWSHVSERPHRFGLMQRRRVLKSWNNVPFHFSKSYANYLLGKAQIAHSTELPLVYVDPDGKEKSLQQFWNSDDLSNVNFRVERRAFMPYFLGSIHYGDFVRRFGYEARMVIHNVDVTGKTSYVLNYIGTCLADIFDVKSETGFEIIATVNGVEISKVALPAGSYAGLLYRPIYFLDTTPVTLEVRGICQIRELIIGALP